MRKLLLSLLLLVLTAAPAAAFDTPEALLKAVYAPYFVKDFDWSTFNETKYRSRALNALVAKDEKDANGEVGRLDFDPYVAGQDYQLLKLKIGKARIKGATATDEVTFLNGLARDLVFSLVKEADGWKIDNVVSKTKGDEYSLKAILEGPLG